jgi:hypothetical protein
MRVQYCVYLFLDPALPKVSSQGYLHQRSSPSRPISNDSWLGTLNSPTFSFGLGLNSFLAEAESLEIAPRIGSSVRLVLLFRSTTLRFPLDVLLTVRES